MKKHLTLTEKRFFEWHEDDVSVTLRAKGGSYGLGSETLVLCMDSDSRKESSGVSTSITGVMDERNMKRK